MKAHQIKKNNKTIGEMITPRTATNFRHYT